MFEKNKTQQNRQAKDKRGAKKALGAMQANHTIKVSTRLLHLRANQPFGIEFADGTRPLAQSQPWGISEIQLRPTTDTMCEVQFIFRRNGSSSLSKNVKRNRSKRNGQITSRQKGVSESNRSLSQTN